MFPIPVLPADTARRLPRSPSAQGKYRVPNQVTCTEPVRNALIIANTSVTGKGYWGECDDTKRRA